MQTYPPGTRIGQYEIASRPMMGGMGVVYFALDHGNDGRPVALKTFRPELLPDRAARDRFLREGTAWIELGSHPHIVRCYKVEYIDPTAFLVLELIAKEQNMSDASLRSWLIPGQPLPLEQALLFALQIARGMQYATEKIPGFVHRDLKPENILVGADKLPGTNINRLRVTDFGLVKTIANSSAPQASNSLKELKPTQIQFTLGAGTPLYMAPEQWRGEPVGVFTDVYALGCILYEMLTGQHVAIGHTITDLQAMHSQGRLHPIPAGLPEAIREMLEHSLGSEVGTRYQTWHAVVSRLESVCTVLGVMLPEKAEAGEESKTERLSTGISYNDIGASYLYMGNVKVGMSYFEKALAIAREVGSKQAEGVALGNLGSGYTALGDMRRAIRYHEQALAIDREIGFRRGEWDNLRNLGIAYANLGDAQRAISYLEESLAFATEIHDRNGEAAARNYMAAGYLDLGDAWKAIEYYEEALTISQELNDRRTQCATLSNSANAYAAVGDTRRAINYYEQALAIAKDIGDWQAEGNALGNLGVVYLNLEDPNRAISYLEQSLTIRREIGDRRGEGVSLINLGQSYVDLKEINRGISCFEHSLTIFQEIGDRHGEGDALGGLGVAYIKLYDMQRAIVYLEQAITIRREIGDVDGLASDTLNMALLYAQQEETSRALPLAQEAARIFLEIGSPKWRTAEYVVARLQGREMPAPEQGDLVQAAQEAFFFTDSFEAMQVVVRQYPDLTNEEFIQALETIVRDAPAEIHPHLAQRLIWLKQITNKQKSGLFGRLFRKNS